MQQLKQCPTEKRNKLVAHNQECKKKKKKMKVICIFLVDMKHAYLY